MRVRFSLQMGQMPRIGMKRKHEDEPGSVSTSPRIGMGYVI